MTVCDGDNTIAVHLTIPSRLEAIDAASAEARRFVERCRLGPEVERRLVLVLEELITNTVKHGRPAPDAPIEIDLAREPRGIRVRYRDAGPPFDPDRDLPDPGLEREVEERRAGGLGWPLIRHYCPEVEHRYHESRNDLRLLLSVEST